MTDQEMEDRLRQLGRAIDPGASMARGVMERIEQVADAGARSTGVARPRSRLTYRLAAVFVAAAACLAALIFVLRSGQPSKPRPQLVVVPQTQATDQLAESIPRLIDYQRAYAQSTDALEALLQQRPSREAADDEPVVRVGDVMRADFNLYP